MQSFFCDLELPQQHFITDGWNVWPTGPATIAVYERYCFVPLSLVEGRGEEASKERSEKKKQV
jgi:hypothetical protein